MKVFFVTIVIFAVVLFGFYYFLFTSKDSYFDKGKQLTTQDFLNQNKRFLQIYKDVYNTYPDHLLNDPQAGYVFIQTDRYERPFFYKVSPDGQSYELRSLGHDNKYGTPDDILPN